MGGKGLCEVLLEEMSFQPSREDGGYLCCSLLRLGRSLCLWVDDVCVYRMKLKKTMENTSVCRENDALTHLPRCKRIRFTLITNQLLN